MRARLKDQAREQRIFFHRSIVSAFFVLLGCMLLWWRLFQLQVLEHEAYAAQSVDNRVRIMAIPPSRGLIYDRHGRLLADNLPSYSLEMTREEVKDLDGTLLALRELVEISDKQEQRFRRNLKNGRPFDKVALRLNLSAEEVARLAVNQHRFPGVEVSARLSRRYPQAITTAHALGYVGRINEREMKKLDRGNYSGTTHIGKLGVERHYESALHGTAGYQRVEVNASGRVLRVLEREPPVPGKDLHLTIDAVLQDVAHRALSDYNGALVAIDPWSGEVLALVSKPSYDINLFVNGISFSDYGALRDSPDRPLFNRAIIGQYPPGSTLKPIVGLAGLEDGVITPQQRFFAGPYYTLPGQSRRYRDWKKSGHGWVTLDSAIAQSCDVYFYDLAYQLGIDRLHEAMAEYGLGQRTGIDAPGEATGLLPSREWKLRARKQPWFPGETLITGIGQGYLLTTPLQLANVAGTLATDGLRFRPRLLYAARDPFSGEQLRSNAEQLPAVESDYWSLVKQAMIHVTHAPNGTARRVGQSAQYTIAGKTGTAQVFGLAQDEEYDASTLARKLHDHALFIAFAPAESPEIAVALVVENGGSGSSVAAPIVKQVLDYYLLGTSELLTPEELKSARSRDSAPAARAARSG